jgi:hypothetical protein
VARPDPYRIFLASPGDVAEERERVREAVEELNVTMRPIAFEVIGWETHTAPGLGEDPQAVVKEHVDPADCDIFLGIIWSRIGTETGRASSGTVEEFQDAYEHWQAHGRPRIMFYFGRTPVTPTLEDLPQLEKALRFKAEMSQRGLIGEYRDAAELASLVRRHVALAVQNLGEQARLRTAVEQTPPEDADAADDRAPDRPDDAPPKEGHGEWVRPFVDVVDLKLRLEAKLTWLCKHLLAGPNTATFATIGSLRYDGFLTDEQARVATRILTRTPESIAGEQPEDLQRTLEADTIFVNGFRASVFDGFVRTRVRALKWDVVPFEQRPGHRPDFFAEHEGGRRIRVAPRFAFADDSGILARTVARLRGALDDEPDEVAARIVVVPDRGRIATDLDASPKIVRYEDLGRVLKG